jgi:hypothetical protein
VHERLRGELLGQVVDALFQRALLGEEWPVGAANVMGLSDALASMLGTGT